MVANNGDMSEGKSPRYSTFSKNRTCEYVFSSLFLLFNKSVPSWRFYIFKKAKKKELVLVVLNIEISEAGTVVWNIICIILPPEGYTIKWDQWVSQLTWINIRKLLFFLKTNLIWPWSNWPIQKHIQCRQSIQTPWLSPHFVALQHEL